MRKLYFLFAFVWLSLGLQAQQVYDDTCTNPFEDISSTGTALGLADDGEAYVQLPFDFQLGTIVSRDLVVGNNGGVLFGVTSGNVHYNNLPLSDASVRPGFYPFWDDIGANGGDVYWEVKGTAPNRYFVIEWYDRPRYGTSDGGTFELILYEGTNEIEFRYLDLDFGSSYYNYGASATIGVKSDIAAYEYSYNTPIDPAVTCIHWNLPRPVVYTATLVPDCPNSQFTVEIIVQDLGGANALTIEDDQGNSVQVTSVPDTVVMGPYVGYETVTITLTKDNDPNNPITETFTGPCPPNDNCDNPQPLPVYPEGMGAGHEVTASTLEATASAYSHTSCDTVDINLDLFYLFVAPASGIVKIITGGPAGADIEAAVLDTCGGTELACFGRSNEKLVTRLTPGETYILQVWHDDFKAGEFTIVLEEQLYTYPEVETIVNPDCNVGEFTVDVAVTYLGNAPSVTVTDNLGTATYQIQQPDTLTF
ncbi:MAG: hypothetical protein GXO27_01320, partial [Chlorobi bacterium]|nr:hypothetical protein [Chlorobiota bacterium]